MVLAIVNYREIVDLFQLTPARGRKRDPLAQLTQWNKGKIFHVISILEGRIYCKYFGLNNCAING